MHSISSFFLPTTLVWAGFVAQSRASPIANRPRYCEPVAGSFYMTGVPANGSATYPIFTPIVSRGVPTLSAATSYSDQWTYNTTDHRLYTYTGVEIGDNAIGSSALIIGRGVVFGDYSYDGTPYGDDGAITLFTDDNCETYVVMTGSDSIYGWQSQPIVNEGLPWVLTWYGDSRGNSALRLGVSSETAPVLTGRRGLGRM